MSRCIVIGSQLHPEQVVEFDDDDFIIAADAGYLRCSQLDIVPDVVVGDFDSMDKDKVEDPGIEVIELPCDKDDTDTLAALRIGLERGYNRFEIYGGASLDIAHTFANIQCLSFLLANGAMGTFHSMEQEIFLLDSVHAPMCAFSNENRRLSLFAYNGAAKGVSLTGAKWELSKATLTAEYPLGVSNQLLGDQTLLSVEEGTVLVVLG